MWRNTLRERHSHFEAITFVYKVLALKYFLLELLRSHDFKSYPLIIPNIKIKNNFKNRNLKEHVKAR